MCLKPDTQTENRLTRRHRDLTVMEDSPVTHQYDAALPNDHIHQPPPPRPAAGSVPTCRDHKAWHHRGLHPDINRLPVQRTWSPFYTLTMNDWLKDELTTSFPNLWLLFRCSSFKLQRFFNFCDLILQQLSVTDLGCKADVSKCTCLSVLCHLKIIPKCVSADMWKKK